MRRMRCRWRSCRLHWTESTQRTARRRLKDPNRKFDILGFDACIMSMGEVACEVRNYADILVGAEGLEPAFGWPYRASSPTLRHEPTTRDPRRWLAKSSRNTSRIINDYDRPAGRSADLSAIELDEIEAVANAFTRPRQETEGDSQDRRSHNKLLLAHWYAQTYKFDSIVDLKDSVSSTKKRSCPNWLECDIVIHAVDQCVLQVGLQRLRLQHSHGLSIYFPWAVVSPDYRHLEFAKKTAVARVPPDIHLKETQRRPRKGFVAADGRVPLDTSRKCEESTRNKRQQTILALKEACPARATPVTSNDRLGANG